MKRKILTLLALVFAAMLVGVTPASAHDTDDWYSSTSDPEALGYGFVGWSTSEVGNVYQIVRMWRTDNWVALNGYVADTGDDGYCGTIQIRYQIYVNGAWADHYHPRKMPVHDCSTGSTGNGEGTNGFVYSKYKVRNVYSRACHAATSGAIVHCEQTWHGPI